MHLRRNAYGISQMHSNPYAFKMHFKCIWGGMHMGIMHLGKMHMGNNAFQMHLKCIWAMPAPAFLERCAAPTPQRVEKVCRGELQGAACGPAHLKCISNAFQMHLERI